MYPDKLDILVVDTRAIVQSGLAQALHGTNLVRTLIGVANLREAEPLLHRRFHDLAIIQIASQRDAGILAAVMRRLKTRRPQLLLFCAHGSERHVLPLIQQGVEGCIDESCSPNQVLSALRAIASGKRYFGPHISTLIAERTLSDKSQAPEQALSPQELAVLDLLGRGHRVSEIANRLELSTATVNTYKSRIKKKTGARNLAEMIRLSIQRPDNGH